MSQSIRKNDPSGLEQSPFASVKSTAPKVRLWMLFVSMMVIAGFSLLVALAVRIPSIAHGFRSFFGSTAPTGTSTNDRSGHLFLLLLCYSSPLLMMIWVGMLRRFFAFQQQRLDRQMRREAIEDSEFTMES
ncbi:MAG: hypothetical protein KGS49_05580 [Planctomycetes bacterium]|jgi:hypothetical protein|nr:hypothetical protein [Planctomycetota bacterium]